MKARLDSSGVKAAGAVSADAVSRVLQEEGESGTAGQGEHKTYLPSTTSMITDLGEGMNNGTAVQPDELEAEGDWIPGRKVKAGASTRKASGQAGVKADVVNKALEETFGSEALEAVVRAFRA
jgi:hypothetical protein